MNIIVSGKNIRLGKSCFVAQGGEGSVYAKDGVAYKIYSDPKKMISESKINELSKLTLKNIIKPLDIITSNRKPVGYTMKFLRNTFPLCQVFTKSFRTRHNIQQDTILNLVYKLRDLVEHVHSKKILIVDLNEMNFLVGNKFKTPYAIDVDSYQTQSFSATAIMESIRDRHCNGKFTQGSDWFSFAILSFQLFVGIHPYKGKHPTVKTMDERMKLNISVLNKNVRIPKACQDLSVIPDKFMKWFKMVLEDGERIPPPVDAKISNRRIKIDRISGSDNFSITIVKKYDEAVADYSYLGSDFTLGQKNPETGLSWFHDGRRYDYFKWDKINLTTSKKSKDVVQAWVVDGSLNLYNITKGKSIENDIKVENIMSHEGSIYAKNGEDLLEIELIEIGDKIISSPKLIAKIMPNATQVFPGVVMQNMLGSSYAFFLPRSGTCCQVGIKDLDKYRIIDAKLDKNVLIAIGFKNGRYDRFIFRFDSNFKEYDIRINKDVNYNGINFVALDTGICVMINENEDIGIFSGNKDSKTFKIINDPVIDGNMKLYKKDTKVLFSKDKTIYKIEIK